MNYTTINKNMYCKIISLILICCSIALQSCIKAPVDFVDNASINDPNISYIDNYKVDIATYKLDSFLTSGNKIFTVGHHTDAAFGTITAGSFIQVNLPADNVVKDKVVSFDSVVVILKPNGNYYGDTALPFAVKIHQLNEKIKNDDEADVNFYNSRTFAYNPASLGQLTTIIKPVKGTEIKIRISDQFGQDLLTKLKTNNTDIRTAEDFLNYFKGIYLTTDTLVSKALYYFTTAGIIRLHYHLNSTFSEEKYIDFPASVSNQFNAIRYNHTGTDLSVFTPFKKQLKKSSLTGGKAYLHSNMASYVKISFPSILTIKELYPYVKIMKAELVITPASGTYNYPYKLPPALYLYTTDNNNALQRLLTDFSGQSPETGNLFIDKLYGEKTNYTYNITDYINTVIAEGRFSESALMLFPPNDISGLQNERLVINDQTLNKGIQLKLYVLGL
jgi:hypothetical protein